MLIDKSWMNTLPHVSCVPHCCSRLWMNKQDRAFTGWLNHLLMPYTPEYLRAASEGDTSAALSDLRLAARVQGAMVACYRWGLREHPAV